MARVLMTATILLIIAFQAYWMRKLYLEETAGFKKTTDVIFRDAMYRLQVQRFSGDTLALRGGLDDNLFMADFISSVEKIKGSDSLKQRLVISMDTHSEKVVTTEEKQAAKRDKDTVIYVTSKDKDLPPPILAETLIRTRNLSDSIPVRTVDSMYRALLLKEGINVNFVESLDEDKIYVRTYERGVEDETLSCGTGVTAAALMSAHNENGFNTVNVKTPGGNLSVEFNKVDDENFTDIWLCGPAVFVFKGEIEI